MDLPAEGGLILNVEGEECEKESFFRAWGDREEICSNGDDNTFAEAHDHKPFRRQTPRPAEWAILYLSLVVNNVFDGVDAIMASSR